ncbi:uncharacterized protein PAC_03617 [Phialocephala subalpina]|uniref:Uncharacterized protein n=1 Tax=Phialocephala subalpina TaxID=576137 RepID=A0A1L7WLT4_9HELO|nr:uncharacterized protein PAC_03617 [Phialocephala subalpina]
MINEIDCRDLQLVNTLAARQEALEASTEDYICEILARFGNIKTLNVIHDDFYDPIFEKGMTWEARNQEFAMIDVWDTAEKINRMEQWLAEVNGTTVEQPHAPFNPQGGHFKPKISEVKDKEKMKSLLVGSNTSQCQLPGRK